ncbi:diguanylate cyclase [Zwartia sp.]|uniref:sensor domain-containing diguanylate cyclase n=1 Tax=Zwartia sp. TaxID=2978004 RepID=UPI00271A89A6|nr:diguanylate cyclase [Zwartia sp.]MDO9023222.1 diguanylate cyclase [Zwartia sp.]
MKFSQTLTIRPRVARNLFFLSWLTLILMLWGFYFYANNSATSAFERNLLKASTTEALVLDDHLDRSLTGIFSKLESLRILAEVLPGSPRSIEPTELANMIAEDLSLRSVSLVGVDGQILTSSNRQNIGLILPVSATGQTLAQSTSGDVMLGQLHAEQPYRDLSDLINNHESKTQSLMLVTLPFKKNGDAYMWVATLNISLFENLWERIGHQQETEISVLDYKGNLLFSHHKQQVDHKLLIGELLSRVEVRQIGHFYFGPRNDFLVVYRAGSQHPKIFVTISNVKEMSVPLREEKAELLRLALGLTALFSLLFWFVYSWYRRYEKAVTYSSNLLRGITAHVMMTQADLQGNIMTANEPFLQVTGYSLAEVVGQNHRIFNSGMQSREFYKNLWDTIGRGQIWKGTFHNRTKSGKLIWVNATIIPYRDQWGKVLHYTAMFSDISNAIEMSERFERERRQREALERMNSDLRTDLNLDHLTGLSNRRGLEQFLAQLQSQPETNEAPLAMLMLDLDYFKLVNDTWGHDVGDHVLKELSRRWVAHIRSSDLLCRFGGEEFLIVLSHANESNAKLIAEKIRFATQNEPVLIKRDSGVIEVSITVSIGIATTHTLAGSDVRRLFKVADEALYEAKNAGRNCFKLRSYSDEC